MRDGALGLECTPSALFHQPWLTASVAQVAWESQADCSESRAAYWASPACSGSGSAASSPCCGSTSSRTTAEVAAPAALAWSRQQRCPGDRTSYRLLCSAVLCCP